MRRVISTQSRKTAQVSVNIPTWVIAAIDAICKRDFASRSQVVGRVLMHVARDFAPEGADVPDPVDFEMK